MPASDQTISKFLSLVLRHQPERIGLRLDANGWASVDDLIARSTAHGQPFDTVDLARIVAESDKQRFAFSDDRCRIRANQGHSIRVDLELEERTPPDILFHGTSKAVIASIRSQGLLSGARRHVHLSIDGVIANTVGARHGEPVVLTVLAGALSTAGHTFYVSANGVWLTGHVPPTYLRFPD